MSQGPQYNVGDIVNGYQWTGSAWVPVAGYGATPPGPGKPFYKKWWVWVVAGVGLLFVIGVIATAAGGGKSASNGASPATTSAAPSMTSAAPSSSVATPTKEAPVDENTSGGTGGSLTFEQENAVSTAQDYLDTLSFSRSGLIDQLEFEGYSKRDATVAVDSLSVDWNEQAALKAAEYLDTMAFSLADLIDQLEFEGFSASQAQYGATTAYSGGSGGGGGSDGGSGGGSVSLQNATRSAQSYLDTMSFSRSGLIDQLEFEGYSKSDATAAVDSLSVDWNEQAALKAAEYLDTMAFSRSGLIDQLIFEGFSQSQATYGVNSVGL